MHAARIGERKGVWVVNRLIPFFEAITLVIHPFVCGDRTIVTVKFDVDLDVYSLLCS